MKKFSGQQIFSAAHLSDQLNIPKEFISKILQTLALDGILISKKGKGGGFAFACDPLNIKLKNILDSLGYNKKFDKCLFGEETGYCPDNQCVVCLPWNTFNKEITYIINNYSLGNICYKLENELNN